MNRKCIAAFSLLPYASSAQLCYSIGHKLIWIWTGLRFPNIRSSY